MLVLLSPSKNLHAKPVTAHRTTLPRLPEDSQALIDALRKLKPGAVGELMDINEKLAGLNAARYQAWHWPHTSDNATAAIYTFSGDVYQGFEAQTMTKAQAEQADKTVRILSGLYGVLRPLDLIQPYRLEMGTSLKVGRTKDLYGFWNDRITSLLKQDLQETGAKEVINLASQEYTRAVDFDALGVPVIDVQFLEDRNGKLQFLSYNAKRSRGWMARYIVDRKVKKSKDLRGFDVQGYGFREDLSDDRKLVFVR
jgi:hypothetical protein